MKIFISSILILSSFFCFSQTDTTHHIISPPLPIVSNPDSVIIDSTQNTDNSPTRFIELGIAPTSYKGDLNSYNHWNIGWHIGLLLARKKRLNGEFSFFGGEISGQNSQFQSEDATKTPNTFFKTTFISGSYNLHLNLIAKPRFKLYVSQGIGLMNFTPQNALYNNLIDEVDTRPHNEDYSTTSLMLPTQIGTHYSLKNNFSFGIKVTWLNTRTDYLDNISEWGNVDNNDNIMAYKIYVLIPLPSRKNKKS